MFGLGPDLVSPDRIGWWWLQTWPCNGWNIILRLYGSLEASFDKTWRPARSNR